MQSVSFKDKKHLAGFTLIELLVSLGVFSILMVALTGLFISALRGERLGLNIQTVQDNSRLVMETMAREIRNGYNLSLISPTSISFTAINSGASYNVIYSYNSSCGSGRGCIMRQVNGGVALPLNGDNINVSSINFAVVPSGNGIQQPRVTISFSMQNAGLVSNTTAKINLQTTVSLRNF